MLRRGRIHALCNVVQRRVFFLGFLILYNGVTVTKGSTLDILTGDTNVVSFEHETSKGHGFRQSPINAFSIFCHFHALLENLLHLSVKFEVIGNSSRLNTNLSKQFNIHTSRSDTGVLSRSLETSPSVRQPVGIFLFVGFRCFKVLLIGFQHKSLDFVKFLLGHGPVIQKLLFEDFDRWWVSRDLFVQFRLRESRLIQFVVSIATVANHINNNVFAPLVSPFHSCFQGSRDSQWIISITVEDRTSKCLSDITAVRGRSRIDRVCSESNLVVDDNVDGATNVKVGNLSQLHCLVYNTLSSNGSISVKQNGNNITQIFRAIAAIVLLGANLSDHHRVDAL
mmetsp:Transcript_33529/g.96260  ORF Transcript_33529/g.96260 Transcript_33529/m.96260 type:complete len:338 (-) Transcript_33529:360-1373(-)